MIFGLRHGERADYGNLDEKQAVEIACDPNLTILGVKQADCSGKFLQEKIDEYESNLKEKNLNSGKPIKTIIVTSPFLRTIQTAYGIAKNIKNLHENSIFIQEHFCEYLSTHEFKEDPMDQIYYKTRSLDELNKYADLQGSNITLKEPFWEDPSLDVPKYVEKNIEERTEKVLKSLFNHYVNNYPFNEYVLIYISHARVIQSSLDYLGGFYDFIDYCGVVQIEFPEASKKNPERMRVLLKGESTHLKWDGLIWENNS